MKANNIKKILCTVFIFHGIGIVCIPYLMLVFIMLVMTTDGGMNTLSIFNLMDILSVILITSIICGMSLIPHTIGLKLLKKTKLEEKNILSTKTYKVLMWIVCLLIFIFMCSIHFDFSIFY